MDKTFPEAIKGIRSAVVASEVREDIAQMGEYVEQFANPGVGSAGRAAGNRRYYHCGKAGTAGNPAASGGGQ